MMFRITNNSHQKIKINDKISILGNSTIIENITIDNRLQDLVNKSDAEVMKIRNLGKKSLKEVLDKVKELDLNLKDED